MLEHLLIHGESLSYLINGLKPNNVLPADPRYKYFTGQNYRLSFLDLVVGVLCLERMLL